MNKTRFSPSFIWPARAIWGALALALLTGCARPKLAYTPNAPLMARNAFFPQDENGMYFDLKAGVEPFADDTDSDFVFRAQGATGARSFSANLAREGSAGWPRLSPEVLARALAAELAGSNLVSDAQAVIPETDAGSADILADNAGDNLLFRGRVLQAELDYSDLSRGRVSLSLEIDAYGTLPGNPPFANAVWSGTFNEAEDLNGRRPAEAMADALQKIYGQAVKNFAQALTAAGQGSDLWRALDRGGSSDGS
ncbi:MAG TPA: hypothetical protein VNH15_01815 [Elusimicrobiota bacterium]|nr:hypothetical protein [Elusimicrobiota bacterium]